MKSSASVSYHSWWTG